MANKFTISTVFSAVDHMTSTMEKIGAKVGALGEKINKSTQGFRDGFGKSAVAVGKFGAVAGGVAAAAGAAVWGLATKAQRAADSINDTANALGISTKALQEYRYVAALSGMETADMDSALSKLTINLGKGGKEMEATLAMLGLTAEQLRAAGPDQVLELVADGMKNVQDSTTKAAITTQLFGKSSVRMVNALSQGSEGLKQMREEAQATGYVMDEAAIGAGARLGDSLDRLKATFEGLMNRAGSKFVPFIEKVANGLQQAMAPGGALSNIMDGLMQALESMLPVFDALLPIIGDTVKALGPLISKALKAATPLLTKLVAALEKILPPLLDIVSVVVELLTPAFELLAPILDIVLPILEGMVKVIAFLARVIAAVLKPVMQDLAKGFTGLRNILSGLWNGLAAGASAVWSGISAGFTAVADGVVAAWTAVGQFFTDLWSGITAAFQASVDFIMQLIQPILDLITMVQNGLASIGIGSAAQLPAAASAAGVPMSANTTAIGASTYSESRSTVDVNFNNPPAGANFRQTGAAPGVNLNMGRSTR